MRYFKKLNENGTVNMIGVQEVIPSDAVEISAEEYNELYRYIQENAVHIDIDEVEEEGES